MVAIAAIAPSAIVAGCSGEPGNDGEVTGASRESIQMGSPATMYPEAVYVLAAGFIPCSGVVLAPKVVLTAGHCGATNKKYVVTAPHAGNQVANGSDDWSPFTGSAAKTPDVRLIFLDTPIHLASYPVVSKTVAAPGTKVVDVGRTLNGSIEDNDYVSPTVTIQGTATKLGFPFNYEAQPDISEDGDSGGPIEILGAKVHEIIGIVDTDTVEQNIPEKTPIDMFARLDGVASDIEAQVAARGSDAGTTADAGDAGRDAAGTDAGDAGEDGESAPPLTSASGGGGCSFSRSPLGGDVRLSLLLLLFLQRRRRS
jgi:hypothetical protein